MFLILKSLLFFSLFLNAATVFSDSLSLSGNPSTLTISTATAGQNPNSATNTSTTYNLTTTLTVRTINGKINSNMPTGITLKVQLAAPSGASSTGSVAMSTTAANLITGIPKATTASNLTVTYTLSATPSAVAVTNATKTLTLTLQ